MRTFNRPSTAWNFALGFCAALLAPTLLFAAPPAASAPERRAVDYLSAQVPRWSKKNNCFSCHNNGDGGRALLIAGRLGLTVDKAATRDTLDWLRRPRSWEASGSEEFRDKRLAAIQFASAQRQAHLAGSLDKPAAVLEAAELVAREQSADGGWDIDVAGSVGSPATYGKELATAMSLRVLKTAAALDGEQTADRRSSLARRVGLAKRWLQSAEPKNVPAAAGVVIGLAGERDAKSKRRVANAVRRLRQTSNAKTGGWGPFRSSPSEPFDTAIALVALTQTPPDEQAVDLIAGGRRYLEKTQLDDGGWPETTRPAGDTSYAQHLSTTAWATIALLRTKHIQLQRGKP